jgi:hypothetical protein
MLDWLADHFWPLAYRIGAIAMNNLIDDPAMLALAFC